jgi:phage terminase large subunit
MEHSGQYAFIPSMVSDNPALIKNDPGYVDRLKANKNPLLVKAYLEGSWDIQAGQFFEDVSRETHLVDPFEIPHHWRRFGGFDTGFNHPAAFGWYAVDEDGVVYKYRELCEPGLRTEELVKNRIAIHEDTFKLQTIEAGPDCWNKHASGPSVEEKFAEASGRKLYLTRANNDRIPGWGQLRDYLALREGGPLFRIFKTCPMTFDAIVRATHDTKKPEDVLKVDAVEGDPYTGDDLLDETRYALMSRPRASIPIKKEVRDRYAVKSKRVTDWKTV